MATSPLHITNGDADAKKVGEILGEETLPWRDFLHDGPVRPGLLLEELSLVRARFISGLGYGSYDSILVAFQNRDACKAHRSLCRRWPFGPQKWLGTEQNVAAAAKEG